MRTNLQAFLAAACVALTASGSLCIDGSARCRKMSRPEDVLRCMENAIASRDIGAYAALLAQDFRWYTSDSMAILDRRSAIETMREMFDPQKVVALSLLFAKEYRVVPVSDSNAWLIENVGWIESCDIVRNGFVEHMEQIMRGATIKVRSSPPAHRQFIICFVRTAHSDSTAAAAR